MARTLHLRADDPGAIEQAAALLRAGGLVAFATETVYGLGAHALRADAVTKIFEAKGRPAWDPLIVHLAEASRLSEVVALSPSLDARVSGMAKTFWPGPLTLLLPRNRMVPDAVTAGRPLVGVRVPRHPVAAALLQAAGIPVAAPSANRFGHVSPTTAEHVLADLDGRIDAVLDAGPCAVGVESTVLDPATEPMTIYRAGGVSVEALRAACPIPGVAIYAETPRIGNEVEALPSPGVGIRHYAPDRLLELVDGTEAALRGHVEALLERGRRVGVLLPADWEPMPLAAVAEPWGAWSDAKALAAGLFAGLRALEELEVEVIVCPLPPPGGLRDAVRDRLRKAAWRA